MYHQKSSLDSRLTGPLPLIKLLMGFLAVAIGPGNSFVFGCD
jgi:hypothetical protein